MNEIRSAAGYRLVPEARSMSSSHTSSAVTAMAGSGLRRSELLPHPVRREPSQPRGQRPKAARYSPDEPRPQGPTAVPRELWGPGGLSASMREFDVKGCSSSRLPVLAAAHYRHGHRCDLESVRLPWVPNGITGRNGKTWIRADVAPGSDPEAPQAPESGIYAALPVELAVTRPGGSGPPRDRRRRQCAAAAR